MPHRLKMSSKKHHENESHNAVVQSILREAKEFLQSLENLRSEIIIRDETFKAAKANGDREQMEHYHKLASVISKKCLDYGRELCEKPIPYWVDSDLPKDKVEIARHSYDVIRNKLCASLNVFDSDLLPNARALVTFSEDRI